MEELLGGVLIFIFVIAILLLVIQYAMYGMAWLLTDGVTYLVGSLISAAAFYFLKINWNLQKAVWHSRDYDIMFDNQQGWLAYSKIRIFWRMARPFWKEPNNDEVFTRLEAIERSYKAKVFNTWSSSIPTEAVRELKPSVFYRIKVIEQEEAQSHYGITIKIEYFDDWTKQPEPKLEPRPDAGTEIGDDLPPDAL